MLRLLYCTLLYSTITVLYSFSSTAAPMHRAPNIGISMVCHLVAIAHNLESRYTHLFSVRTHIDFAVEKRDESAVASLSLSAPLSFSLLSIPIQITCSRSV